MARRKKMNEEKRNIIQSLISEYDIKTADDMGADSLILAELSNWNGKAI